MNLKSEIKIESTMTVTQPPTRGSGSQIHSGNCSIRLSPLLIAENLGPESRDDLHDREVIIFDSQDKVAPSLKGRCPKSQAIGHQLLEESSKGLCEPCPFPRFLLPPIAYVAHEFKRDLPPALQLDPLFFGCVRLSDWTWRLAELTQLKCQQIDGMPGEAASGIFHSLHI